VVLSSKLEKLVKPPYQNPDFQTKNFPLGEAFSHRRKAIFLSEKKMIIKKIQPSCKQREKRMGSIRFFFFSEGRIFLKSFFWFFYKRILSKYQMNFCFCKKKWFRLKDLQFFFWVGSSSPDLKISQKSSFVFISKRWYEKKDWDPGPKSDSRKKKILIMLSFLAFGEVDRKEFLILFHKKSSPGPPERKQTIIKNLTLKNTFYSEGSWEVKILADR